MKMNERYTSEEKFHDSKYGKKAGCPYHYRFNPTYDIFQEMKIMMGDVKGKKIIEYGCGDGWTTAEMASLGGKVYAFDISSVAIKQAQEFLEKKRLAGNCTLSKMKAESLDYPDDLFDLAFGFAILHHLDLNKAIPEMLRVMRNGACAFFAEPLGTNPIINMYRRFTPQYRTKDESPLNLDNFACLSHQFKEFYHTEYYLTAILSLGLGYLRLPDSAVRYCCRKLFNLDRKLLARYPRIGKYAWYTIIKLVK